MNEQMINAMVTEIDKTAGIKESIMSLLQRFKGNYPAMSERLMGVPSSIRNRIGPEQMAKIEQMLANPQQMISSILNKAEDITPQVAKIESYYGPQMGAWRYK